MLTCKQTTELLSHERDRAPPFKERLSVGFHLAMCRGCRNYRKQLAFLGEACRRHPAAEASPEAGLDDAIRQ